MGVEHDVCPGGRVGVGERGSPEADEQTARGGRVACRLQRFFQSASASIRRLIKFWAGASASWITATTSSASGTAAASPIPPRLRVVRIRIQAPGRAKSANQASPFGM